MTGPGGGVPGTAAPAPPPPPLTLADCSIAEAGPGWVRLMVLPGGALYLVLTEADLERLSFLMRGDEPDPADGPAAA
jgi:hypothetical protein